METDKSVAVASSVKVTRTTEAINPVVIEQEKESDMNTSTPVLPVTVPAGGNYGGFGPAEAALVKSNADENGHRDNQYATACQSKSNAIEVLTNRFELEKSIKRVELTTEKNERENQQQLHTIRRELTAEIKIEAEKTRDMFANHFSAMNAVALSDAKARIMQLEARLPVVAAAKA